MPHIIAFINTSQIGAANFVATKTPAAAVGNANIKQQPIIFPIITVNINGNSLYVVAYPITPVYSLNLKCRTVNNPMENRKAPTTPPKFRNKIAPMAIHNPAQIDLINVPIRKIPPYDNSLIGFRI